MDFKKIIGWSKLLIAILVVFTILFFGLTYLLGSFDFDNTLRGLILIGSIILSILGNLIIYSVFSYHTGRSGLTAIEGGVVAAFSFAIVHILYTTITVLFLLVSLGSIAFSSSQTDPFPALLLLFIPVSSNLLVSMFILLIGVITLFFIGGICAYLGSKKWY
jgi:hypothetical protein